MGAVTADLYPRHFRDKQKTAAPLLDVDAVG
jgi:hypothetical protein